ncbi:MAG: HAMP domain-containing protein [Pseudomonadaceae bacterium]|nr:HAMP domain-containing protein [Pseudomonadaceae bacterium]
MIRSLRLRLLLGASLLVLCSLLLMLPAMREAFDRAVENFVAARLAADANTLIAAAQVHNGQLQMPQRLADDAFNQPQSRLLGYLYDAADRQLWHSASASDERPLYQPQFDGQPHGLARAQDSAGQQYFVYDSEITLNGLGLSVVTMQPVDDFERLQSAFMRQLGLWLGGILLTLLSLLWLGLNWLLRPLGRLRQQLDEIEAGQRELLDEDVPNEIQRLTHSLNRLLSHERLQRERYRDTLGDLAHSLKTPLTVLQGVADGLRRHPAQGEQVATMQAQISRMSQQIDYQLQRASQRHGALLGHRLQLQPLLQSLLDTLDKVYADKRVQTQLLVNPNFCVQAEDAALLELFGNLLENAYRLCLSRVQVCAEVDGDWLRIAVEDDGPGIPTARRALVLQRGIRSDSRHPGQGIGLAVVQDILEGYQGELQIDDSALGGARFSLRLPRASGKS